jgi:hypothetical protein
MLDLLESQATLDEVVARINQIVVALEKSESADIQQLLDGIRKILNGITITVQVKQ